MAIPVTATLGGVSFHGWVGWVGSIQNVVDVFARLGQSGSGAEVTHIRSAPVSISAWIANASAGNAITALASVEALQGTVVSLTDPWARTISNVRVTEAHGTIMAGKGTELSTGVPTTHLVRCDLVIERLP